MWKEKNPKLWSRKCKYYDVLFFHISVIFMNANRRHVAFSKRPIFFISLFFSSGKGTHLTDPIILYTLTRSAGNLHTITIATTTYPEKITEEYPQWRIFFPSIFCLPDMFYE